VPEKKEEPKKEPEPEEPYKKLREILEKRKAQGK